MTKIHDALTILDRLFPPVLADRNDPTGLQVGDVQVELKGISVALEATVETLHAASGNGSNLLVTHHPLIFRPISKLIDSDPTSRAVMEAVKLGLCVYSCHTNADWAASGLNDFIAEAVEVVHARPLEMRFDHDLFKVVTFVPADHIDAVSQAMFQNGAGVIGDYENCSFRLNGEGTFLPGEGTDPYSGEIGRPAKEKEIRLEIPVKGHNLLKVVDAMIDAHPYEETAYDVYPLRRMDSPHGVARIGDLKTPRSPRNLAATLKERLGLDTVTGIGPLDEKVTKVAICTGAGASLLPKIASMKSTVYITGDIRYHDARLAEQSGLAVLDIGHFGSEIHFIDLTADRLERELKEQSPPVAVHKIDREKNPFILI